jgi:hypothetical protein
MRRRISKAMRRQRKERPWENTLHQAKNRCDNKRSPSYRYYGKRGIRCLLTKQEVERLWLRDNAWALKRPSIDRIDPDGHYEFSNCRFIEVSENSARARRLGKYTPKEIENP